VYLTRSGQLRVLDFGIARLRELSVGSQATKTGATMGTPDYMPPEQARGLWDEVDGTSDLWAVGATMFSLLSGRSVHEGRTPNEVLLSAMTKQAPPLASVAPDVSRSVAAVIDRALAFDKTARWSDARAMQNALRRSYEERHGSPITLAPRLAVPSAAAIRTVASASASTTAGAVVTPVNAASEPPPALSIPLPPSLGPASLPRSRGPLLLAVMCGALTVSAAVTALVVTLAGHPGVHGSVTNPATADAVSPMTAPPSRVPAAAGAPAAVPAGTTAAILATATASAAAQVPTVSPTDLPSAVRAPRSGGNGRPAPTRPAAAPTDVSRKTDCATPFTLDPSTGKKIWKEQCL
jgi:serine/threonine-protein kinase